MTISPNEKQTETPPMSRAERVGIGAVLLLAALLRLWELNQNQYGNTYYAAAVRSMIQNWRNFFFVSFDPGGFVSVDKPPLALWTQAMFARLFGFHGLVLLLPQAIAGTLAVGFIYYAVRRTYGPMSGLLAGCMLALTPISVAVDRSNNTDSMLVFFLVLSACAALRAVENGSNRWLLSCAVLVSLAFNTKSLAAYVVLPSLCLLYLFGAPKSARQKFFGLCAAAIVLAVVSLSWPLAVDLTPPSLRPYVGSSQNNSELALIFGYNGLGRLNGNEGRFRPGGFSRTEGRSNFFNGNQFRDRQFARTNEGGVQSEVRNSNFFGRNRPNRAMGMAFMRTAPGPFRLANPQMAAQFGWLFPLVIFGFLAWTKRSQWRLPISRESHHWLLWGVWLLTYTVVYSFARGIIQQYYLATMAPAMAALVGISMPVLWRRYCSDGWGRMLLPVALIATACFQIHILSGYPQWQHILTITLSAGVLLGSLLLLSLVGKRTIRQRHSLLGQAGFSVAFGALLISPICWAITPILGAGTGRSPIAGPNLLENQPMRRGLPDINPQADRKLVSFLVAHRAGAKFLLATPSSQLAAPIIITTGEPIMAIGGFMGRDPILTTKKFEDLVKSGAVRYALINSMRGPGGGFNRRFLGGFGTEGYIRGQFATGFGGAFPRNPAEPFGAFPRGGGPGGMFGRTSPVITWITEHGKIVNPALWRPKLTADDQSRSLPGRRFIQFDASSRHDQFAGTNNFFSDRGGAGMNQRGPGGFGFASGPFGGGLSTANLYDLQGTR